MDRITLDRIKLLHPKVRDEATLIYQDICKELSGNVICRFTHTLRTFAEQDALFARGRTKSGSRVTNSRAGFSYHNYGLAIDIALLIDKDNNWTYETLSYDVKADNDKDKKSDWIEVVNIFKQYGWTWGGDWKFYDAPHFEKTFGYSVRNLLQLHSAKKVDKSGFVLI
jgi:peptidoglycan L-alanyl-D-glutamate endopeptidase CwlK